MKMQQVRDQDWFFLSLFEPRKIKTRASKKKKIKTTRFKSTNFYGELGALQVLVISICPTP
jgi:hypothetical protein